MTNRQKHIDFKTLKIIHIALMCGVTLFMGVSGLLYYTSDVHNEAVAVNQLPFMLISIGFALTILSIPLLPALDKRLFKNFNSLKSIEEKTAKFTSFHLILVSFLEIVVLVNGVALILLVLNQTDFTINLVPMLPLLGYAVYMAQMIKYFPGEHRIMTYI